MNKVTARFHVANQIGQSDETMLYYRDMEDRSNIFAGVEVSEDADKGILICGTQQQLDEIEVKIPSIIRHDIYGQDLRPVEFTFDAE